MSREKLGRKDKPATIEEFEPHIRIDPEALDDAIIEHPELFYRVSEQLSLAMSRRDAEKSAREELEADLQREVRQAAARLDEKITDKNVAMQVETDPRYRKATQRLLDATSSSSRWAVLKEAFAQRSYALGHLVDLFKANYFGSNPQGRSDATDRRAESNREEMAKQRDEYNNRNRR